MTKNSKTAVSVIVTIVVLAILSFLGYNLYKNNGKLVLFGSAPTDADKACAGGGAKIITGSCTKPKMYPVSKPYKETCFTSAQLNLNEGDAGPDKITDFRGTWYFNYQSGDRFCYVNTPL